MPNLPRLAAIAVSATAVLFIIGAVMSASPPTEAAQPPISDLSVDARGTISVPARDSITLSGWVTCEAGEDVLLLFAFEQRSRFGELATSYGQGSQVCSGGVDNWQLSAATSAYIRPGQGSLTVIAIVRTAVRTIEDEHFVLMAMANPDPLRGEIDVAVVELHQL